MFAHPFLVEAVLDREFVTLPDTELVTSALQVMVLDENAPPTVVASPLRNIAIATASNPLVGVLTEDTLFEAIATESFDDRTTLAQLVDRDRAVLAIPHTWDVFATVELMRQRQQFYLPILNRDDRVLGFITPSRIRQAIGVPAPLGSYCVSDVMAEPRCEIAIGTSVREAVRRMQRGARTIAIVADIPVDDAIATSPLLGCVTRRDIVQLRRLTPDLSATPVEAIATGALPSVRPQDGLAIACHLMQQLDLDELPVTDDRGNFVGTVSFFAALRAIDPYEPPTSPLSPSPAPRSLDSLERAVSDLTGNLTEMTRQLAGERQMRQQMERSLARERELTRVTLQSIDDAVIITDVEGRVQFLNVRAEQALGLALADVTDRAIEDALDTYSEIGRVPTSPPIRQV
ncbi:MAG: CBS domain-containing protein, partial [Cyanobacteria bacterium J06639_1]